jgi:DNA-binding NarL/FixJ family response regulator
VRKVRILLADDHPVVRAGLRALLDAQPDMQVLGEAPDGEQAVEQARALQPDVVVMDISMPGVGGLEATRRLRDLGLETRVLVLTVHAEERYLLPVLQAGGSGYVRKSSAHTDLLEAIRRVDRGDVFLYPSATAMLLSDYLARLHSGGEAGPYQALSEREREVLKLSAEGYTAQEVGERLALSPKTVETYRQRIMAKLDLESRHDLVRYALRVGLLVPEGE